MKPKHPSTGLILCFGEILWDCLPRGIFLGGAPLNVAYHLRKQGKNAVMVSSLGKDWLGEEALRRLRRWGFPTGSIHRDRRRATGTVQVTLDNHGKPRFDILRRVAWDSIAYPETLTRSARHPIEALVFGSLSQRSAFNRSTLQRLLQTYPETLRVFDVNLRPPFDSLPRVWKLMRSTDLLKLNDDELRVLVGQTTVNSLEDQARLLARKSGVQKICVTAGAEGAGVLWGEEWVWEKAPKVKVVDTVGAGDAFLAGFLAALRSGAEIQQCLKRACRLAGYVAAQPGAQPDYRIDRDGHPSSTDSQL